MYVLHTGSLHVQPIGPLHLLKWVNEKVQKTGRNTRSKQVQIEVRKNAFHIKCKHHSKWPNHHHASEELHSSQLSI